MLLLSETANTETDAKIYVNDLTMVMVNRHLNKVRGKVTSEDLLLPSSICIRYDQLVEPPAESDVSTILIDFEPLELKLGYRELNNFKGIHEVLLRILEKLDPTHFDSEDMSYETLQDKLLELELMKDKQQRSMYGESK